MSAKAIFEADGKETISRYLRSTLPDKHPLQVSLKPKAVIVTEDSDLDVLVTSHPWLLTEVRVRVSTFGPSVEFIPWNRALG